MRPVSRRRFLGVSVAGLAAASVGPAAAGGPAARRGATTLTPRQALATLKAGNGRWVRGQARHPAQSPSRRAALRLEQHPFATIVSCVDSRVPPELVFDRGIGELIVVRTGANVLDTGVVLGSVEFARDHLATPLIFVLGHQRCGAVKAAADTIRAGGTAPGHVQAIVEALRPAYKIAITQQGDMVDNMVRAQVQVTVSRLRADPPIKKRLAAGELNIVGGYYSLDTGAVSIIA